MIKLTESKFKIISEGTHIFCVSEVKYDQDFGKLEITLLTKEGLKDIERFTFIDNNGEVNEKALNAFSYFARQAMDNNNLTDIDEQELLGKYIEATVTHVKLPKRDDPTKTSIFYKLSEYAPATGFEGSADTAVEIDF